MLNNLQSATVALIGEEEHGGGGWHDNLQQAGDLVAMVTNKDVCIRGKSQRSAVEGTHAFQVTVMEKSLLLHFLLHRLAEPHWEGFL